MSMTPYINDSADKRLHNSTKRWRVLAKTWVPPFRRWGVVVQNTSRSLKRLHDQNRRRHSSGKTETDGIDMYIAMFA